MTGITMDLPGAAPGGPPPAEALVGGSAVGWPGDKAALAQRAALWQIPERWPVSGASALTPRVLAWDPCGARQATATAAGCAALEVEGAPGQAMLNLLVGLLVVALAQVEKPSMPRFARLRAEAMGFAVLGDDWDGDGAREISLETVRTAGDVLGAAEQASRAGAPVPRVQPFADGSVFFKWVHGDREVQITVKEREIAVQRWEPLDTFASQGRWEGISPAEIWDHIKWLLP